MMHNKLFNSCLKYAYYKQEPISYNSLLDHLIEEGFPFKHGGGYYPQIKSIYFYLTGAYVDKENITHPIRGEALAKYEDVLSLQEARDASLNASRQARIAIWIAIAAIIVDILLRMV
ncbi:MAG: hypothetical protein RLO81_07670 [Fulvivirga sp.]|uniref:hypothetical protein n=1 Tax=Fulvivirga sp. TaxID=1931237 RepID=UPI0032EF0ED4